ncbi:hypothetical protein AAMO2058_000278100 [Amorphochlora amoebiformis]
MSSCVTRILRIARHLMAARRMTNLSDDRDAKNGKSSEKASEGLNEMFSAYKQPILALTLALIILLVTSTYPTSVPATYTGNVRVSAAGGGNIANVPPLSHSLEKTPKLASPDALIEQAEATPLVVQAKPAAPAVEKAKSSTVVQKNDEEEGERVLFCYGVVMNPPEKTLPMLTEMVQGCDGYEFYSNFSDPSRKIVKVIPDAMKVGYGGAWGSALNTKHFWKVWRHMSQNEEILKYKWFVKLDVDTVFFPKRMKELLKKFNHHHLESNAWGSPIPGPAEVFSLGALHKYRDGYGPICDEKHDIYNKWQQEDMYIYKCLEVLGFNNTEPPIPWRWDGILPEFVFHEMERGKRTICFGQGRCLDGDSIKNRAVYHPLKTTYRMRTFRNWIKMLEG